MNGTASLHSHSVNRVLELSLNIYINLINCNLWIWSHRYAHDERLNCVNSQKLFDFSSRSFSRSSCDWTLFKRLFMCEFYSAKLNFAWVCVANVFLYKLDACSMSNVMVYISRAPCHSTAEYCSPRCQDCKILWIATTLFNTWIMFYWFRIMFSILWQKIYFVNISLKNSMNNE